VDRRNREVSVYAAIMLFGKHREKSLADLPVSYLRWLAKCDLDDWLERCVRAELSRRGERFVDAAAVVADIEEGGTRLVSGDDRIGHDDAGRLCDHLLSAFETVRRRHGIGAGTELVLPGERPMPTALVG
jgi:hypothetical protein